MVLLHFVTFVQSVYRIRFFFIYTAQFYSWPPAKRGRGILGVLMAGNSENAAFEQPSLAIYWFARNSYSRSKRGIVFGAQLSIILFMLHLSIINESISKISEMYTVAFWLRKATKKRVRTKKYSEKSVARVSEKCFAVVKTAPGCPLSTDGAWSGTPPQNHLLSLMRMNYECTTNECTTI